MPIPFPAIVHEAVAYAHAKEQVEVFNGDTAWGLSDHHCLSPDNIEQGDILNVVTCEVRGARPAMPWRDTSAMPQRRDPIPVVTSWTPPPTASGALSAAQVGALWLEAGGSPSAKGTAECIAWHESTDVPSANNYFDNGGTQTSWGLFQISNGTHEMPVPNIDDPLVNTEQAVLKSDDGSNWSAWGTAPDCGV